ncbi:MAG: hypothetical protein QOH52_1280, partial [Pseudonocardiales bacterium]|nr:hypothetical protein [Pseudonocardiales bacterium]
MRCPIRVLPGGTSRSAGARALGETGPRPPRVIEVLADEGFGPSHVP